MGMGKVSQSLQRFYFGKCTQVQWWTGKFWPDFFSSSSLIFITAALVGVNRSLKWWCPNPKRNKWWTHKWLDFPWECLSSLAWQSCDDQMSQISIKFCVIIKSLQELGSSVFCDQHVINNLLSLKVLANATHLQVCYSWTAAFWKNLCKVERQLKCQSGYPKSFDTSSFSSFLGIIIFDCSVFIYFYLSQIQLAICLIIKQIQHPPCCSCIFPLFISIFAKSANCASLCFSHLVSLGHLL